MKLLRIKDRDRVLSNAKKLKGQKRRELLPQMKAARERGDFAVLRYDKLIVHKQGANGKRSDA